MAIQNVNVKIGDLNTPIEIQRFEHDTDEYGFTTPIWTTIARPRCRVDFDDRLIRQILRDDGVDATTVIAIAPATTTADELAPVAKTALSETA